MPFSRSSGCFTSSPMLPSPLILWTETLDGKVVGDQHMFAGVIHAEYGPAAAST